MFTSNRLWRVLRRAWSRCFPQQFGNVQNFHVALAFARAIGEYGSVALIAGNMPMVSEIAPLLINTKLEQYDYVGATAVAITMLVISLALLLAINRQALGVLSLSGGATGAPAALDGVASDGFAVTLWSLSSVL